MNTIAHLIYAQVSVFSIQNEKGIRDNPIFCCIELASVSEMTNLEYSIYSFYMKKVLLNCLLPLFCLFATFACAQERNGDEIYGDTIRYHYNKDYDYVSDTMPALPFRVDSLLHFADKLVGRPYLSPGRHPDEGFDCSGFTFYLFKRYGIYLPYSSHLQAEIGKEVSLADAQAGDLIFFQGHDINDHSVHHVALLVNKKGQKLRFIHATSKGIQYDVIDNPYYKPRYIGIRRVY